jgi:phage terminase large subunit
LRNRDEDEDPPLYVDPRCKELIKDLEEVTWRVDATGAATGDINKSDRKRTHTSDALGYYVASAFPLKPGGGYKGDGRIV